MAPMRRSTRHPARLASDVALINQISHYIIGAGGKRIRPRLVLLFCAGAGLRWGPSGIELAATVEFIHTATLLHDDVVDESSLRRGRKRPTPCSATPPACWSGDFLYSRAFQMMVSVDRMRVLEVLADATNVIAEGEVLQLMNMHDPDLAVDDYLRVIRFKTAKLFEASARLGAVLAEAPPTSKRPAPTTAARWAPPSSWSTTCSTTKATPTNSARTSATTCARASPRCRCWWPWRAATDRAPADPPRHRAGRGRPPARDRRHRAPTGALEATRAGGARRGRHAARGLAWCCPIRRPAKLC
jgi:hypothetical protein